MKAMAAWLELVFWMDMDSVVLKTYLNMDILDPVRVTREQVFYFRFFKTKTEFDKVLFINHFYEE